MAPITPTSKIVSIPPINSIPQSLLPRFDPDYVKYYNKYSAGRLATHQVPIETYRANPEDYIISYGRQLIDDCWRISEQECPVAPAIPGFPSTTRIPQSSIRIRIFEPAPDAPGKGPDGKRAAYINFHGGGWVFGGLNTDHEFCKRLVWDLGCVCFDVDYRLSPEFKYPIPVEDCWTAFQWVRDEKSKDFDLDISRIAVGGCSAGGHLSAIVAHLCRDASIPLAFQLLTVPVCDLHVFTPTGELRLDQPYESYRECWDTVPLPGARMSWFHNNFLGCPRSIHLENDWKVSPIRAPNFSGLAPALVVLAELDPLRDEGRAYGKKMIDAGCKVDIVQMEGAPHIVPHLDDITIGGRRYNGLAVEVLSKAFSCT